MLLLSVITAMAVRIGLGTVLIFIVPSSMGAIERASLVFLIIAVPCLGQIAIIKKQPDLVAERIRPGKGQDKVDVILSRVLPPLFYLWFALLPVSGGAPTPVRLCGLFLLVAGLSFSFWAQWVNRFASTIVRIQDEHKVVCAGPYRRVRHPMYAANLMIFPGGSILAGSWLALAISLILSVIFIIRIGIEERALVSALPDYAAYSLHVRWRVIPCIW